MNDFALRPKTARVVRYQVIPPLSREGRTASIMEALPELGHDAHGRIMGVGSITLHCVYRYNFDERSGTGKWNLLYYEDNAVAA